MSKQEERQNGCAPSLCSFSMTTKTAKRQATIALREIITAARKYIEAERKLTEGQQPREDHDTKAEGDGRG